jgi:hypothetical protein
MCDNSTRDQHADALPVAQHTLVTDPQRHTGGVSSFPVLLRLLMGLLLKVSLKIKYVLEGDSSDWRSRGRVTKLKDTTKTRRLMISGFIDRRFADEAPAVVMYV